MKDIIIKLLVLLPSEEAIKRSMSSLVAELYLMK